MDKRERRAFAGAVEIRAEGDKKKIRGYAAVFNVVADIGGWFEEEIDPGAFDRALKEKQDVRCLLNHNADLLLGRTKSGTLTLGVDEHGLWYEDDPPENTVGEGAVETIQRGDMSGSSFGFIIRGFEWISEEDKPERRIIKDVDLFDVSPCTFPAYEDTDVAVREWRQRQEDRKQHEQRDGEAPENRDESRVPATIEGTEKAREARAREARLRIDGMEEAELPSQNS